MKNFLFFGLILSFTTLGYAAPEKSDLEPLVQKFDALVISEEKQEEYSLTQERLELKISEDQDVTKIIVKLALDRFGGDVLERLEVKALSLLSQKDVSDEVINPIFNSWSLPFYCATFRKFQDTRSTEKDWWTDKFKKDCKKLTRTLLSGIVSARLSTHLVLMEGNAWGEYRQALVIVRSESEPEKFLLYDFDLVHEI